MMMIIIMMICDDDDDDDDDEHEHEEHDDNVCIYLFIINIIMIYEFSSGAGVFGAINFMDSRGKIDR